MINTIKKAAYQFGYLLIIAAWLYTLSFVVAAYWNKDSSPQNVQKKLEQHLTNREQKFNAIAADTNFLYSIINNTSSGNINRTSLFKEDFGLFIYQATGNNNAPSIVYWNNNHYYINPTDLLKPDSNYFVDYQNGVFKLIKETVLIRNKIYYVTGLIPVQWDYFTENKYLTTHFDGYPNLDKQYTIVDSNDSHIHSNEPKKELFKIKFKQGVTFGGYDRLTIFLRVASIFLLLLFFTAIAKQIVVKHSLTKGFLFLLALFVLLRFISYQFPFPFYFNKLPLFDTGIYASNDIHPTLGDLFINTILSFWLISFYKQHYLIMPVKTHQPVKNIFIYCRILLLVIAACLSASIIRSLITDSKIISFDVANFFSLNIYTGISFVILGLLILSFLALSHILLKPAYEKNMPLGIQIIAALVGGLSILSFNTNNLHTVSNLFVLLWLVIYLIFLFYRKKDIHEFVMRSSAFVLWIIFLTVSVALLLSNENKRVEIEQRKHLAENLILQSDPLSETLLSIATGTIDDRFLKDNFKRFYDAKTSKQLRDSLIEAGFSGYLNKYDTRIYAYDNNYQALYNDDSTQYSILNTLLSSKAKPTLINNLYSFETEGQLLNYIFEKQLYHNKKLSGIFIIVIKPKLYISEAIFPELFKQSNDVSSDFNLNYAYAIYKNGKIVSRFNDYDFPPRFTGNESRTVQFVLKNNNGYSELWYNSSGEKQIIIVKHDNQIISFISLFAWLFCSFIILSLLLRAAEFLIQSKLNLKTIRASFNLSIRSQIQFNILFVSIFSFIVIAIATISFFIFRFNKANEERLFRSIKTIAYEIKLKLDDSTVNTLTQDNTFEKSVDEIAQTHNTDITIFEPDGKLKVSTQPYIYNKKLLGNFMDPAAYEALHFNGESRYSQQEQIGTLNYVSIYAPILQSNGTAQAYINIPYLNSQTELNQEISGFLATLINLNAFIFLIAGAIAFLIANRITSSFRLMGKKMEQINFGEENEVIEWHKQDEIGVLVNEYNKMVKKLEASAKALAKSEREGAWREMARQVAHEIKNPLTPMKLSIQYLEHSIDNNSGNIKQLTKQVADTLVKQIDQLSRIAGDFSQFAHIGNITVEKFDVSEVLRQLINLYRTDTRIKIEWKKEKGNYWIEADKIQINRLFTNLLKNAIEASENNEVIEINIEQQNKNNTILIAVSDNGKGIDDDEKNKIFAPNFTTKSSGTGLGLAICKGIVEHAGGKIWFAQNEIKGTTFYVELPVA